MPELRHIPNVSPFFFSPWPYLERDYHADLSSVRVYSFGGDDDMLKSNEQLTAYLSNH